MAVPEGLQWLVEEGVIDGVHERLMSGKEASVFVVGYRGEAVAAKVYKARERRTFKATADYTEGRNQTRNTRDKRAMAKRSSYGRGLVEESWREMEYRALFDAFHGGVRVPKPIMLYEDVLLMELVVDEEGAPAPRLADFDLPPEQAEAMLREIHEQARRLLVTGRVHGDLSAFNVLIARGGPTIIDLPQVLDASRNNSAREILRRDLRNIAEHLARYDARLLRFRDAGEALFRHWERGTLEQATEPHAGSVRSGERPQGGRRARLAESGRMNRDGAPRGGGHERGPRDGRQPEQRQSEQRQHDQRQHDQRQHDQRQHEQRQHGGPRHDRGPQQQREQPRQHGGPRHDRGPQQHEQPRQHGAPRDDRRPQHGAPRDDRRPQHDGPRDDRRPQHGAPRDGRGPQHGAPRDDRRPQHGAPRDDRAHPQGRARDDHPPPQGGARSSDRRGRPPVEVEVIRRRPR